MVVMPARALLGFWSHLRKRPGFVTVPWSAFLRILLNSTSAGHHEPVGLTSTATVSLNPPKLCLYEARVNLKLLIAIFPKKCLANLRTRS
jgi:hypothetical protein